MLKFAESCQRSAKMAISLLGILNRVAKKCQSFRASHTSEIMLSATSLLNIYSSEASLRSDRSASLDVAVTNKL